MGEKPFRVFGKGFAPSRRNQRADIPEHLFVNIYGIIVPGTEICPDPAFWWAGRSKQSIGDGLLGNRSAVRRH
jgi:hypothetical protein